MTVYICNRMAQCKGRLGCQETCFHTREEEHARNAGKKMIFAVDKYGNLVEAMPLGTDRRTHDGT